jgi:hypothetical protein
MAVNKKLPPALRHGAYSTMSVLPGESVAEFEELHRRLMADWGGGGDLEDDTIATMARVIWRKQHMATIRVARIAQRRASQIQIATVTGVVDNAATVDLKPAERVLVVAQQKAREELGEHYDLVEMGDEATFEDLLKELQVIERLDAVIDRCIRRLLMSRGLRSLAATPNPLQTP